MDMSYWKRMLMEMLEGASEKYREESEDIDCPICKKVKVSVTFIAGYISWSVSRIASKSARTKYYHDPKIRVNSGCPNCRASRQEIKDALERGTGEKKSHEDRLKRIRDSGLPTTIEG